MKTNEPQKPSETQTPIQSETISLANVIEESKARIADSEAAPAKNKGGRPKGSKTKNRTVDAPANSGDNIGTSTPVGSIPTDAPGPLLPVLRHAVRAPFEFAYGRTGFPGWKLDADETEELAILTDKCLQHYFPNLGEKSSVLMVCLGSFAIVFYGKVQLYNAALEATAKKDAEEAAKTVSHPSGNSHDPLSPFPTLNN